MAFKSKAVQNLSNSSGSPTTISDTGGDQKVVAEAGDLFKAYVSASSAADAILSYLVGT